MTLRRVLILALALFLLASGLALATAPIIERYVIGGGGGHTEAGLYTLDSTLGQAAAGWMSHPPLELCAGFWCVASAEHGVYLPLVLKSA